MLSNLSMIRQIGLHKIYTFWREAFRYLETWETWAVRLRPSQSSCTIPTSLTKSKRSWSSSMIAKIQTMCIALHSSIQIWSRLCCRRTFRTTTRAWVRPSFSIRSSISIKRTCGCGPSCGLSSSETSRTKWSYHWGRGSPSGIAQ